MAGNPHWFAEIFKDKFVKFFIRLILGILAIYALYALGGVFFGYKVKFLSSEKTAVTIDTAIKNQSTPPETIQTISGKQIHFLPITVTTKKGKTDQTKPIGNTQNIDSGASGIQNNAPNYGNQAGRDMTVISEKELQEADKIPLLNLINKLKKDSSITSNCFGLYIVAGSNGGKVASQITSFLISKGYQQTSSGTSYATSPIKGVIIGSDKECITITVGVL